MKTIRNALKILALFKDKEGSLGVNDIALSLGYEKSYVSRVLSAMRDMNFVIQDPETRKYTVGLESFALGIRYIADTPITRTALPIMRKMSDQTGDSVFLTIRHENFCRHILAVEGPHFLETRWRVGIRLPLYASASGKVLLAFTQAEAQQEWIADNKLFEQFTSNTITEQKQLIAELVNIKNRGFSNSHQELSIGLSAWAVPVYGENGVLIAALSIIMPESTIGTKSEDDIVQTLRDGARQLSALCGSRVYPH